MSVRKVLIAAVVCLGMAACLPLTRRMIWPPPLMFRGHTGKVYSVVPSPDGKTLASTSADKTLRLWDVATGKELAVFRDVSPSWRSCPVFNPDGRTLAYLGEDGRTRLWNMATGEGRAGVPGHAGDVAFSPDGLTLAVARDTAVMLWDVRTGEERATYPVSTKWIDRVLFSPDGQTLAAVYDEHLGAKGLLAKVRLWDVAAGKERATFRADGGGTSGGVRCAAFSPDGKTLATGDSVGAVKLWDVAAGTITATLDGETDEISALTFSPDGKTLASLDSDDEIKLWDVASGRNTGTFNKGDPWIKFSRRPRLNRFIGEVFDAHPEITNALPGTGAQPRDVPLSLAFTPTGTLMAFGSDGHDETAVKMWRVTTVPVGKK